MPQVKETTSINTHAFTQIVYLLMMFMEIVYSIAGRASETDVIPCAVQIDFPYVIEQMLVYVKHIKVGFFTFASLRPKECVLAGFSGPLHVCLYPAPEYKIDVYRQQTIYPESSKLYTL